jgi:anti-sigma factor RsiW
MADVWTSKLDVYLDGEIPSSEMSALDAHVRSCPACAADVLNRLQLKRAVLDAAGKNYSPTPQLRQRVQGMIEARRPRQKSWTWLIAAAATIAVIMTALVITQIGRRNLEHRTYSEIADLHVSTLASATPVDVISTDRHTVKPWFEGKIPFTFNLPELQNSDFALVGGRIAYLDQTAGAHLIYHLRKHQISVFIFPDKAVSSQLSVGTREENTFAVESWTQGELRYLVIGDVGPDDMAKLRQLFKNAA